MKLRSVFETLLAISEGMNELFYREEILEMMTKYIESLGGVYLARGISSHGFKLSFPWGDVAIKISKYGCDAPTESDLKRLPVLREHYLRPLFRSANVIIQPLADVSNSSIVSVLLREKFRLFYRETFDSHEGNVGEFRGRLINFDPMV